MREKHKGLVIPLGALADDAMVDDVLDHGDPAPVLPRRDVGEVHFDHRDGEELKRDKKGEGVFVLLEAPGKPVVATVEDDEARRALDALIRK